MRVMARNLVLVTGSRALDGAVRFFTVPVVLGYFGRIEFGLIALAFSMHVFLTIADFGISVNAVRRLTEYFGEKRYADIASLARSASFFYLVIGLVNLLAVVLVGVFGQAWFKLDDKQAHAFLWMMLSLGVSSAITWAFSIYRQILHAASQVGWDESINLLSSALTVAVIGATLHFKFSVQVYFALVLMPPLLPLALRVRRVKQIVPGLRVGFSRDWALFRPLVGTSLWLFAMSLSELLANHYRPIILAQQSGLESVADFRIIQQVAGFATLLISGIMSVLYPVVARLDAAGDQARLNLALTRGSRLLLWAHLGLLVPMAFLAAPMLRLYVGRSFEHLSVELAVWLLTLVAYHNSVISSLVLARGRLAGLTLSSVLAAVVTLTAAYFGAARYGVAAMVATYTTYMAVQLAFVYLVALPAAGGGSGWAMVAHVFPRPLLCAAFAAAAAFWLASALDLGAWMAGIFFLPLFSLSAFAVGGVRQDWHSLRQRPA